MATDIHRILRAFEDRVWAIQPDKLQQIAAVLAAKASTGQIPEAKDIEAATRRQRRSEQRAGTVAVIPLFGTISQRMGVLDAMSGGASLEAFTESFREAASDEDVEQILIRFDSPGGSVFGVEEAAQMIADTARDKRVVALLDPMAGSAAYWLATQASEVVVTPSGQGGSIGCYSVHFDRSGQMEEAGIEVTVIRAGENKGEGNPYEPLSEDAAAHLQSLVDFYDAQFTAAVARGRGVDRQTVKESFGQGRMFDAQRLVTLGMADRIASFDDVLEALRAGKPKERTRFAAHVPDDDRIAAWIQAADEGSPPIERFVEGAARVLARAVSQDTDDDTPTSAQGQAPPDSEDAPTAMAPEAREEPMSGPDKAAPTAGASNPKDAAEAIQAERQRVRQIRQLGRDHGIEQDAVDNWIDQGLAVEQVNAKILERLRADTEGAEQVNVTRQKERVEDDPRRGFRSHRDFLVSVMENQGYRSRGDVPDERLRPLALMDKDDRQAAGEMAFLLPSAFTPTGFSAAAGSDEQGGYADRYGGFAVPTTVQPGLLQVGTEDDPTAGRTQGVPMASPKVAFNARVDKDHSDSVSGGLTVTRSPETVEKDSSRFEMEQVTLNATGLFGLAFATEEILTDSPISFAALIASGFDDQFSAHLLEEKIRGGGGNEYLGVLNSPAAIEVAKESGQAADTIEADNIINMRARAWKYDGCIWLANHDTLPQLIKLAVVVEGSTGGGVVLIYQPSMREDRPDMLLGRPIFYTEFASTLGDVGDVMLVNWSQYLEGLYQPLQSAESIHVRFVNHERAFKFWLRNAGAPWWRSALTPKESNDTLSPIVTLAERA